MLLHFTDVLLLSKFNIFRILSLAIIFTIQNSTKNLLGIDFQAEDLKFVYDIVSKTIK